MLSKVIDNNSAEKTDNTKKNAEQNSKTVEYVLPVVTINFFISDDFCFYSLKKSVNYIYDYCKKFDYPIKIPFLEYIFLLLLLKLILSILERSISIIYNKTNIDRACIV